MLHVHRAERADRLADALSQLLAHPLDDPFAAEVVAVPTRGMERWLTQRMSSRLGAGAGRGDGICAGVAFPFPTRLLGDAVAAASGVEPEHDPWLPERAAWPLLDVVAEGLHEPWLATLAHFLGYDGDPPDPIKADRRLTIVRHLAGLFHHYALHRPAMIEAWARGEDCDALGEPLDPGARWQAELWRRLRARIGLPGPAERRRRAGERLTEDPSLVALPARLSLFGLTRLPAGHLEILRALARGRDVHLFLLHPSDGLWQAVAQRLGGAVPVARRSADPTAEIPHHPLLASWGQDARELQLVLAGAGREAGEPAEPLEDHVYPAGRVAPGLLGRLQADVRADRRPPGAPLPNHPDRRAALDPDDRSVQIHACHGRARQVEVIRDAILHALCDDPELEPRDVIIMCPDVEVFAPLIEAAFGSGEVAAEESAADATGLGAAPTGTAAVTTASGPNPADLRVRLADRSLRQTNPLLGVVTQLLELAPRRVTASEVLDLADRAPVRRRFRLDDDDLARMRDWVSEAGVRWGLDAPSRARYKLDGVLEGTWSAGLDRLLLGVTMTEDDRRLFHGVLPLDDVDSRSIDLAGRLAELIARLHEVLDTFSRTQPIAEWAAAIGAAADLLSAPAPLERWQRAELQRILDELVADAGPAAEAPLAPAEVTALLASRLEGRPTRANFRTGHLTVCTLVPMRSVPHRVVCLLGLDDGAFPRKAPRDGDDLMLDHPHVGERDPRSEDRQLLLDALLAATERLIVTYTGNDERTNTERPPAVPVGELLEAIDATVHAGAPTADGRTARDQVLIRHPLQPFDPRNFVPGRLGSPEPWSYDRVTLAGARAMSAPRDPRPPFLRAPLPAPAEPVLELDDLVRFVEHPVRAFLRQRLGIALRGEDDEIADGLAIELDGLQRWGVGQRLLEARLAGVGGQDAYRAEIARGLLPPGMLGHPVIRDVLPMVTHIVDEARKFVAPGATDEPIDVRLLLGDGRRLAGTVSGACGEVLLTTTYSRVAPKHRIAAWVRLLAVVAAHPERELTAVTIGRAGHDDVRVAVARVPGADAAARGAWATEALSAIIDLRDRGMREPLPLFCETSAAYAEAARGGRDPVPDAEQRWKSEFNFDHEDRDPSHLLVLGGELALAQLLELAPAAGEDGPGWDGTQTTRLGRLAVRLWSDLLEHEEVSTR